MADIPGLKNLRLLSQQPIAMVPSGFDFGLGRRHTIELTFNDGTVMNVAVSRGVHDEILVRLQQQKGVAIEQRVAAQERVVGAKADDPGQEKVLPLDASMHDAVEALREVTSTATRTPEKKELEPWKKSND